MINVPLLTLVQIAYPGMSAIVGGPAWMGRPGEPNFDAARFDLNAKSDASVDGSVAPHVADVARRTLQARGPHRDATSGCVCPPRHGQTDGSALIFVLRC